MQAFNTIMAPLWMFRWLSRFFSPQDFQQLASINIIIREKQNAGCSILQVLQLVL